MESLKPERIRELRQAAVNLRKAGFVMVQMTALDAEALCDMAEAARPSTGEGLGVDGKLTDATFAYGILFGFIQGDTNKRFVDGEHIRTSTVQRIVAHTKNSVYEVELRPNTPAALSHPIDPSTGEAEALREVMEKLKIDDLYWELLKTSTTGYRARLHRGGPSDKWNDYSIGNTPAEALAKALALLQRDKTGR